MLGQVVTFEMLSGKSDMVFAHEKNNLMLFQGHDFCSSPEHK